MHGAAPLVSTDLFPYQLVNGLPGSCVPALGGAPLTLPPNPLEHLIILKLKGASLLQLHHGPLPSDWLEPGP